MSEATTDEQSGLPQGVWIAVGAGAGMSLGASEGGLGTGAGLVLGAGAGVIYEIVKCKIN
jgi:L-aminopeptidase/D-esterase-like protein